MKKILFLLAAVMALIVMGTSAYAADDVIRNVRVNPYGGETTDIDTISWEELAGKYYLFLPSDTDPAKAKVWPTATGTVELDGEKVVRGQSLEAFTAGEHKLTCGGASYDLTVCYSANIPAVYIRTESGSMAKININKDNKEPGVIRVYEGGELTLDKDLKQIKGRGNTTWYYDKKPYNIKFDKKTDMFGMGAAKKWTLLANYIDESLVRNTFAWEYADAFDLHFTSRYKHIDLYANGEYLGNYVMCESVEVGKERVNIHDLAEDNEEANPDVDLEELPQGGSLIGFVKDSAKWVKIPNSPEDITGGYLLEYEFDYRYYDELCGFTTPNGQHVVVKEPEIASEAEVKYIKGFVDEFTEAVYSETGYNAKGRHYSEYVDMESFVNMYILQELSANLDAGKTSFYAYKDKGSDKMVFSPVWDFDHSFGRSSTVGAINSGNPNNWWANSLAYDREEGAGFTVREPLPTVLTTAYTHRDFRDAVQKRWAELIKKDAVKAVRPYVHELSENLEPSAVMNIIRWNPGTDIAAAQHTYRNTFKVGESFVDRRFKALTRGFSGDSAMLYYDGNGGIGAIYNPTIASVGDSVKIVSETGVDIGIKPPKSKYHFAGWNTRPDGSGKTLKPGDYLTLTKRTTTLYAVWKTSKDPDDPSPSPEETVGSSIYNNMKEFSTFTPGEMLNDSFVFNDAWFRDGSSTSRNDKMAHLSMQIVASAKDDDPEGNLTNTLTLMGFDWFKTQELSSSQGDTFRCTYGFRECEDGTIAAVVMHSFSENGLDPDDTCSAGTFMQLADMFDLDKMIDQMDAFTDNEGRKKLWIMGAGKGGATANALAHRLNQEDLDEKAEVFAYTFESPKTMTESSTEADDNIHNYMCSEDPAAVYGVTYDLPAALENHGITNGDINLILESIGSKEVIPDDNKAPSAEIGRHFDTLIAGLKLIALAPVTGGAINAAMSVPKAGDDIKAAYSSIGFYAADQTIDWIQPDLSWDTEDEKLLENKDYYLNASFKLFSHSVPDDIQVTINGSAPVSGLTASLSEGTVILSGTWRFTVGDPAEHTISFDPGDGEHAQGLDPVKAHTGDMVKYLKLPVIPDDEKKTFDGWFDEDGTPANELIVSGDMTLRAKYTAKPEGDDPLEPPTPPIVPELNIDSAKMKAGETFSIIPSTDAEVIWSTSNKKVAVVKDGKVKALVKGKAVITAAFSDGTRKACKVTVTTSPKLSKKSITVRKGKTRTIKVSGKATGVSNKYKNTKIARVISKKTARTLKIRGLKKGKSTLKIRVNGKWLKLKVTVK